MRQSLLVKNWQTQTLFAPPTGNSPIPQHDLPTTLFNSMRLSMALYQPQCPRQRLYFTPPVICRQAVTLRTGLRRMEETVEAQVFHSHPPIDGTYPVVIPPQVALFLWRRHYGPGLHLRRPTTLQRRLCQGLPLLHLELSTVPPLHARRHPLSEAAAVALFRFVESSSLAALENLIQSRRHLTRMPFQPVVEQSLSISCE
jgi:hypothetical protein